MSDEQELINDLSNGIRDVIQTYRAGHTLRVATVVGLLHCIAHEILMDAYDDYIFNEDLDDESDF